MLAPNQEPPGESRIDKMRKFLSSPLTRKKPSSVHIKTFGTPLEVLLQRGPSDHSVPFIITRLCQYILKRGLMQEGLFRISGNARSVERLKASFDRSGDAPLETDGDVPSAAALLKLFLRELPDPIIPLTMHCQFLNAVRDKDKMESVVCLAALVEKLPPVNYNILNYLFCFLRKVSEMEEQNRMSASSLGIVFGPNLFRVTEDFVGLKEQSLTNQIVTYFISEHDRIFRREAASFTCNTCYTSEMTKTNQVSAMVASWPEARGSSSAMLSTWSLGPLCSQNDSGDDFPSLNSLSHSMVQPDSGGFVLKCQDYAFTFENNSSPVTRDNPEFPSSASSDAQFENCATICSPTNHSQRKSSLSMGKESSLKEYYIMDEEPLLCHSSLTEAASNHYHFPSTVSSSATHPSLSEKMSSLSVHSFPDVPPSSPTANHNRDHSFSSPKESFHAVHGFTSKAEVPSEDHGSAQQHSNLTFEKSEEMLKDTHKVYPRGRRRHIRHPRYEERRSHSELRTNTRYENEDEFDGNSGDLSLYDKTDVQHNSTGSIDESGIDTRHSWPAFRKCKEEDDIALSPLPQQLGVTVCGEASVSPSAFRNYLSHRNLHLDPSLPPSPPVEQEDIIIGNTHEISSSSTKQLNKKVHSLKKKIKIFEDNFEKLYGYKPSHAEKCSNIAVKKMISELNKAKQDLKEVKDDALLWDIDDAMQSKSSRGTNTRSSQGLFSVAKNGAANMSIEDTVKNAMSYLSRQRRETNRPDNLEEMKKDELVAEKIAIQKVLLNFESMHGRPSSKVHRELVRPLYDRYRLTKRMISRSGSSKDNADLMPILEHETMDFRKTEEDTNLNIEAEIEPGGAAENRDRMDFVEEGNSKGHPISVPHINFHELSLSELEVQLSGVREEKRRLRKLLREFEEHFKKENGRKAQREDKRIMESCYTEYKNAKAKLKLLEALVSKYDQTS